MTNINITLKDGAVKQYPAGTTILQVAESLGRRLAAAALVGKVNGEVKELAYPLKEDAKVDILTFDSEEGKDAYRHTTSHIMAQAVQRLYPEARLGIGPAIESGFYYDFDSADTFKPEDLAQIEKEMDSIIKADYPLVREELSREDAVKLFTERGESYKVELINDLPEDARISTYRQGDFIDLCAGPHLPSTGKVKAVKLMSLAGAYWRGSEKNKMLQRIYGTSFPQKAELDDYIYRMEEAKKRDHRKLGHELGLFTIVDEGPGFPIFMPKGMILRNQLEAFWREIHNRRGYLEIRTPIILNRSLWERSGHWDHYKENMYFTVIDDEDYCVKPMNCPGGLLLYKTQMHSYREFPLRVAEMGLVHRHEKSGVLHGLMRVRAFTQDDAHIYMMPSQIVGEIKEVISLVDEIYSVFGFSYHVELSTRPEKAIGSLEDWDRATNALRAALEENGMQYKVNEGDGAFYGPKIDFHLRDTIGRTWQCGTIQLDFQMPELFDLTYIGEDGQRHRPVMIHRTVLGSMERFIGVLTEHYAGAFPAWLSPVQARVIPITERHHEYGRQVHDTLKARGIRVELDERSEKVGYKIREGQLAKIPYLLVVGDREQENQAVAVRDRSKGDLGAMPTAEFIQRLEQEIRERS
ncbi:MAG: threonine--tRNA ligase [Firmicutes bacterium]|nr:threonine--tRNA ligase [Bacillota bacterium]